MQDYKYLNYIPQTEFNLEVLIYIMWKCLYNDKLTPLNVLAVHSYCLRLHTATCCYPDLVLLKVYVHVHALTLLQKCKEVLICVLSFV